ncbi:MAG: macrolide ABC transporter ATP-binding protein, partial [Planctomycetes bacterium]|nr:macrolide ABC transporter ATP-binding protein [Planctomycetota bacterium]
TGKLDPETEAVIMALLEETHRQGTTLLIVTHNHQLTGAADRVLTLSESGLREG